MSAAALGSLPHTGRPLRQRHASWWHCDSLADRPSAHDGRVGTIARGRTLLIALAASNRLGLDLSTSLDEVGQRRAPSATPPRSSCSGQSRRQLRRDGRPCTQKDFIPQAARVSEQHPPAV